MPSSVQEKKGPPIHMLKVLRIPEHQEYRNPFPEKSMTSHGFLMGQKASDPVSGTLKAWSSEPTAAAGWTQCQRNSEGEAGPCHPAVSTLHCLGTTWMLKSLFTPFPGKKVCHRWTRQSTRNLGGARMPPIPGPLALRRPPSPAATFRKLLDCTTSSWEAGVYLWPSAHWSGNPRWAPWVELRFPSASIPAIIRSFLRLWLHSWFKAPLLVLSSSHQQAFHTRMALRSWREQN